MGRITESFRGFRAALASRWTPERARDVASECLRALVRHCWREVPAYRRRFEAAGFDPQVFRGLEDLARLPITERADLRDSDPADTLARSRLGHSLVERRTSGSAGAPLTIWRSPFEDWLLRGLRLQAEIARGDSIFRSRFGISREGSSRRIWGALGLTRVTRADCLEPMPQIVAKLLAADPAVVGGYTGSVALLARALSDEDRGRLHVREVYCGAETMTPHMREVIRRAFGVAPLTTYGSHEFNLIAIECPRTGLMHISVGTVIVEVLRDGVEVKEGEQGETVITALHSYAMPFVRYRLGDLAIRGPAPCPCGAPYPTLEAVQGRVVEMFNFPGGRQLHPYAIVESLLEVADLVRQYQIVQEQADLIRVRLVGVDRATADQRRGIEDRLEQACGPGIRIVMEAVEEIRPEPNGKFRPYYSLVPGEGSP